MTIHEIGVLVALVVLDFVNMILMPSKRSDINQNLILLQVHAVVN